MAKLKAFVATLEEVDEAHRDFYVEDVDKDGKKRFKLDAEGLEDVSGLKSTVATLRRENGTLKTRAKLVEGIESDEEAESIITAGREALEARRTGKPIPEVESIKAQMQKAHGKELEKLQKRLAAMTETVSTEMVTNRARAEILAAGGKPTLLLPHLEREARVVEIEGEDGKVKFETRIIGADGKEVVDASGNPITIQARVAQLRENPEFEGAFEGSGASGSGAPPEGGSGTPTPPRDGGRNKAPLTETKRRSQNYSSI